jgi:hypothetical protein
MRQLFARRASRRLVLLLAGAVLSLAVACDLREPLAPASPADVGPLRSTAPGYWTAERREAAIELPVECTTQPIDNMFRYPIREMCGYLSQWFPIPLEAGEHLLRVRLSGTLRMEGGNCSGWPTGEIGPLGIYPSGSHLPFMRTFVNWTEAGWYYPSLQFEPVTSDSSVVEALTIVSGEGSLGVGRFQPALYQLINHENACRPVGNVLMEVFVRDRVGRQPPELKLTCTPAGGSVRRGESVACTARGTPAEAVVSDWVWQFSDAAGRVLAATSGTGSWGGPMVVSGTIRVSGKVDGIQAHNSLAITVVRRGWPRLRVEIEEKGHVDLPLIPDSIGHLAHTHVEVPATMPVRQITSGPNQGWAYLDAVPTVPVTIHINDAWKPGSAWHNLQHHGPYTNPTNGATGHYCSKWELPHVLREARRHEGSIPSAQTSHADVFRRWVNTHAPQDSLDAAVVYVPDFGGSITPMDWAQAVFDEHVKGPMMRDPQQRHANAIPPGSVDPAAFPCALRF